MTAIALGFSFVLVAAGAWLAIAPRSPLWVLGWITEHVGWGVVVLSALARVGIGLCFFFAGTTASWPDFIQWVGVLMILGGVGLPLLGPKRFRSTLVRVSAMGTVFFRVGGVVLMPLGIALLVGLSP